MKYGVNASGNAIFRAQSSPSACYIKRMTIDVIDLRDFYSQRLGIVARRLINRGIHARGPNAQGQRMLDLGYHTSCLDVLGGDSQSGLEIVSSAPDGQSGPTDSP